MRSLLETHPGRVLLLPVLLVPIVCFAQEQGAAASEVETKTVRVNYANLVFGQPEIVIEGLDPIAIPFPDSDSAGETDPITYEAHREGIRLYQQTIDEMELSGGPWQPDLTEELTAIAELHQQQGSYLEAIEANSRAMQISRINEGLDNLQQVPIVENLIRDYLELDQWEKADQYQNYLFYTQKNAFGLEDPRMIPVLINLAEWNLKSFRVRLGENYALRLTTAFFAFRAASDILTLHFGEDDERFGEILQDMAGTAFLMVVNAALLEEASRPEYASIQEMFEDEMRRIEPNNPRGYDEGLEALERLVEYYSAKDDERLSHAKALISLADWHVLFQRRRSAAGHYLDAYTILTGLENGPELAQEHLGQVRPLPDFSPSLQRVLDDSRLAKARGQTQNGEVEVKFDTTELGVVTNLEILTEETEENSRILTLLRREIRRTIFRPGIVNGEITRTQNNHLRYRYSY